MSEDEKKWEDMKECYKGTDMALLIKKVSALETNMEKIYISREKNQLFHEMWKMIKSNEEKLKELEQKIDSLEAYREIMETPCTPTMEDRLSALEKLSLKEWKHVIDLKIGEHIEKLKELEKRQQSQSFPFQKMKELEQRIIHIKKCAEGEALSQVGAIKNIEAVLRDLINILGSKTIGEEEILYYREHKELFDKLGSEDKKGNAYGFRNKKVWEKEPSTQQNIPFEQLIPQTPEFRKAMESIAKEPSKEISKNVVFPTKLSFQEQYPQTSNYKTPEYIENLRKEKEPSEEHKSPRIVRETVQNIVNELKEKSPAEDHRMETMKWAEERFKMWSQITYYPDTMMTVNEMLGVKEKEKQELIAEFIEKLKQLIKTKQETILPIGKVSYFTIRVNNIQEIINFYKEKLEEARKNQ